MRGLVGLIRGVLTHGPVDSTVIVRLEDEVRQAIPRLIAQGVGELKVEPGRYLCYQDPDFGFVIMALVWGSGDGTAIHDHGTWGVEAVLRSRLKVTTYTESETAPEPISSFVVETGEVMHNLPPRRDVHRVEFYGDPAAAANQPSALSLHIYGTTMNRNRSFIPGVGFKVCDLVTKPLTIPGL